MNFYMNISSSNDTSKQLWFLGKEMYYNDTLRQQRLPAKLNYNAVNKLQEYIFYMGALGGN